MASLLLDIGGTFIKGAIASAPGEFSEEFEVPIDSSGNMESVRKSLREAYSHGSSASEVAVAIPGPFDYSEGMFLMKHKFASVYGLSLRTLAGIPPSVPVRYVHDVNCMLAGEMAFGAARGFRNVALVTLGTGLGFGLAVDGLILVGPTGSPQVGIWNMPYRDGILEDYVSARGIRRLYGVEIGVKEIAAFAAAGDIAAQESFRYAGSILAETLEPVLNEYGTQCLLFGGQISRSFFLMESALRSLLTFCPSLSHLGTVSDISSATVLGLMAPK